MKEIETLYVQLLEWDRLQEKLQIKPISDSGPLHKGIETISITRDADYGLNAEAKGKDGRSFLEVEPSALRRGEAIPIGIVRGKSPDGAQVALKIFYAGSSTFLGTVTGEVHVQRVEIDYETKLESAWFSIWCLNGPKDLLLARGTDRILRTQVTRVRSPFGEPRNPDHKIELTGGADSRSKDYWLVENNCFKLRFCSVPKVFGPEWSRNFAVEVFEYPGHDLSFTQSQAILDALSFPLGRRLVPVGRSWFSEEGHVIRTESFIPWGINPKAECSNPDMPPVRFLERRDTERMVAEMSETFFELRDEFALSRGILDYWMARLVPAEIAFVHLASGLEAIMRAWFRSTKSKSRGKYFPKEEFNSIVAKPFAQIEYALRGKPNAERLIRRLKLANNLGVNEQLQTFFDEIGLPIGDVELHAMAARNPFAHGGGAVPEGKIPELVYTLRSYQTLFHRVVLKLIGFQGQYIDYSSLDFPDRPLLEPLGGPQGDGKPVLF